MATTTTLIEDAAELVKVKGESQQLSAAKETKYLRFLNELLDSWRNEGVDLGLSDLSSGDTVYIDDADVMAIRYSLAELIAEDANRVLSPRIMQRSGQLLNSLKAKYFTQKELDQDIMFLTDRVSNILTGP